VSSGSGVCIQSGRLHVNGRIELRVARAMLQLGRGFSVDVLSVPAGSLPTTAAWLDFVCCFSWL